MRGILAKMIFRLQDCLLVGEQPFTQAPPSFSNVSANDGSSGDISMDIHTDKDYLHTEARCYGGKGEAHGPLVAGGQI